MGSSNSRTDLQLLPYTLPWVWSAGLDVKHGLRRSEWVSEWKRTHPAANRCECVSDGAAGRSRVNSGSTHGRSINSASAPFFLSLFFFIFFAVECIYWAALHNSGIFSETALLFLETICPHPTASCTPTCTNHPSSGEMAAFVLLFILFFRERPFQVYVMASTNEWFYRVMWRRAIWIGSGKWNRRFIEIFLPRRFLKTLVTPLLFSKEPGLRVALPFRWNKHVFIHSFVPNSSRPRTQLQSTIVMSRGPFETPSTPLVPH